MTSNPRASRAIGSRANSTPRFHSTLARVFRRARIVIVPRQWGPSTAKTRIGCADFTVSIPPLSRNCVRANRWFAWARVIQVHGERKREMPRSLPFPTHLFCTNRCSLSTRSRGLRFVREVFFLPISSLFPYFLSRLQFSNRISVFSLLYPG